MERGKEKEREGGRRREFNHHFVVPRVGVMDEGEGELAPPEPRLSLVLSLEQMDGTRVGIGMPLHTLNVAGFASLYEGCERPLEQPCSSLP